MNPTLSTIQQQLDELRAEEARLNEKKLNLARLEREVLAEEHRKKQTRDTEVRACDFDGKFINLKVMPDIRDDVLGLLRGTQGRVYVGTANVNRVPLKSWPNLKSELEKLVNVRVTHSLNVDTKINRALTAPEFTVILDSRDLRIVPGPEAYFYNLTTLPGARLSDKTDYIQLPISEGWRLLQFFTDYKRPGQPLDKKYEIKWHPDALRVCEEEVSRRRALDTIALEKDAPEIGSPFLRGQEFKPFQRVGVKFLELAKGRALLADQMGLGKTWQGLGYAERNNLRTVVVCPAHLRANWLREIINLTGKMPLMLKGREPKPADMERLLIDKPQYTIINYDILGYKTEILEEVIEKEDRKILVPKHFRYMWAELINSSRPDLVIADESHYVKGSDTHRSKALLKINAPRVIPMSGTPVLNRPGEFFTTLHWMYPEMFPSEGRFLNQFTDGNGNPRNTGQLREMLRTMMLRRLKKDVIADLPPLNRIRHTFELSPEARTRYQLTEQGLYEMIDSYGGQITRNVKNILDQIGKLKQVCAHDSVAHCVELARELNESSTDDSNGQGKILIFSQYKDVVRKIANQLGSQAIHWTGDTSFEERTKLEHQFQTDNNTKYLVISLMTGQTGLNLTAAGHVIFADLWWTPAAHAQAEERAYGRLSDMHGADSYYVTADAKIMIWLQSLIEKKIGIINETVEGIDAERDPSFGESLIKELLELRNTL